MSGSVRRFAGFLYSAQAGLQRDGVPIHLGPQARQLLELLLNAEGGVVSKAEIAARLWPDRPPSDDSIDRCAYLLRRPLREAGFGDLIATAYGRGLSLRARVETVDLDGASPIRLHECPVSPRILDHWQIAYELAGARTRDGLERAQAATTAALEVDPESAAVWALSANIAAWRVIRGHLPPAEASAMIEQASSRALLISPDFSPALAVLGWARATMQQNASGGIELLDRAIERDPHYGKARTFRGWARADQGRLAEALDDTEIGLRDSPLDQGLLTLHAWLMLCMGEATRAADFARHALDLRPDGSGLRGIISIAASLWGRHEEAIDAARRSVNAVPGDPCLQMGLAYALAQAGHRSEAEETLAAVSTEAQETHPCLSAAAVALALGRTDLALRHLARGQAEGCPWFAFAACDPRVAPLAGDVARMRAAAASSAPNS